MHIMSRLMMIQTWSEIKGIQSAVFEDIDREHKAEQMEQAEFEAWKNDKK